jgi:hypothetical protein
VYLDFDDLQVITNDLSAQSGTTVCAVVRNELYYLPAFLSHYRGLGVERFIVLDDRSDDGSREYLAAQADVMLLGSGRRYGDEVVPAEGPLKGTPTRMFHIWKTLLVRKFCLDRWAVVVDADEFLVLPGGLGLEDVARVADQRAERAIFGVMLDVYPETVGHLWSEGPFDPEAGWFFDAQPHYRKTHRGFRLTYPGARARLYLRYGLARRTWRDYARWLVKGGTLVRTACMISKPFIVKWTADAAFFHSHQTTLAVNPDILLPVKHYKYTADTYRRTVQALKERQYFDGSRMYLGLERLLREMEARDGSFLYGRSAPASDPDAFARSGNLILSAG